MMQRKTIIQLATLLVACGLVGWIALAGEEPSPRPSPGAAGEGVKAVDFEKDVQPILKATCYECHSAKKIKGKLRLDAKELAMKGGSNGAGITPGKGRQSYLVKRLRGEGDEDRMPLDHDPLSEAQIKTIENWIDQGAIWPDRASVKVEKHWAYIKPVRPELPKVKNEKWPRNGIDYFVLARLEKEGLTPSPEADKEHLLKRASLDLTGLPPSPEEVSAFLLDQQPDAYERAVDRLLDSPHYGERWGRHWLDLARYADSNGYEKDAPRVIWAYRDWVIDAINRDLPFDQFVIEQFAGDMLENPTPQQRIATGFHRNTMINEEGGIDVEEFRDKAIVDRVQTTATALLGQTLQCANCHDHKYDQFSQKEYYSFFALLNNADEPVFDVPDSQIEKRRAEIQAKMAQAESELESKFPAQDEPIVWEVVNADDFASSGGAILSRLPDNSLLASGRNGGTDTYTVKATIDAKDVSHIRLEALTHPSLAKNGPGRSGADGNGNFVLTEFRVTAETGADVKPIALIDAQAPVQQSGFAAAAAIDGNPQTGWAVDDGSGKINENRTIIFKLKEPIEGKKVHLAFTIEQTYPTHQLGRFRLSVGRPQPVPPTNIPVEEQRRQLLAMRMEAWEKQVAPKCVKWMVLEPTQFSRNYGGSITKLNDNSLLFTGDNYYRDEYKLEYQSNVKGITALRLEVLPHEDQPKGGPGRDPEGGFVLSEFAVNAGPIGKPDASQPVEFEKATAEAATPPTIQKAIDGKRDTHWIINPRGDAKPRVAVFRLKTPIGNDEGTRLAISILQNYHQQANLGRVRISVTDDTRGVEAAGVPGEIEEILITPKDQRSPAQLEELKKYFLSITPLLEQQRKAIATLKNSLPKYVTTLVLQERATQRPTRVHHRGDFLNQRDAVEPGLPAVLGALPEGQPKNRLTLAKWLVSEENPLIGRVVMNRIWSRYFGRGIVYTVEDFGVMGQRPTHPELLDWLATELPRQKWSMKAMHRLMVTSATYRQSSQVTPSLRERDPDNILLARGPRMRVEAEIVRDIALSASGLLSKKIGGPSVFPPQPPGISELSYGPLKWVTSPGEDRYRRGMYTFFKRTSPYPGLTLFDAPSSEFVCARRIRSNTPLQALTVLNDQVFVEAAQAMALRVMREAQEPEARAARAVRLTLSRKPDAKELSQIVNFYQAQLERFKAKDADPAKVAVADPDKAPKGIDLPELAAWTTVCRAILNLDETVTKE